MTKEQWIKANGFDKYEISNLGRIRNKKTHRVLKTRPNSSGYEIVDIQTNEGKRSTQRIHRIVLSSFNPVDNWDLLEVDHIDGGRTNNNLDNLRWSTSAQNIGYRNGNRTIISDIVQQLIEKNGYENTEKLLTSLL